MYSFDDEDVAMF